MAVIKLNARAPVLSLRPGLKQPVRLNPDGHAIYKLLVNESSLIEIMLNHSPAVWQENGLLVWRTSLRLEDEQSAPVPPADETSFDDKQITDTYILKPGTYHLSIGVEVNEWPRPGPVPPSLLSSELTVKNVVQQHLPVSMRALQDWLDASGLGDLLEVSEFADLDHPARGLPHAMRRLAPFAAVVAYGRIPERSSEPVDRKRLTSLATLTSGLIRGDRSVWPAELPESLRPRLVIAFRPKKDRFFFDRTERRFWETHRETLWDRLFQEIASLERVPSRRIVAWVPLSCSRDLVFVARNLSADRYGSECQSGSASTALLDARSSAAAQTQLSTSAFDLSTAVPAFLKASVPASVGRAEFEYLSAEPEYVEVIVRGIRGYVIRGGRDWERLEMTFVETGHPPSRPLMLRISVQGFIASGLGSVPPDSDFTRDMEPQYSQALTDYARRVSTELRRRLVSENVR